MFKKSGNMKREYIRMKHAGSLKTEKRAGFISGSTKKISLMLAFLLTIMAVFSGCGSGEGKKASNAGAGGSESVSAAGADSAEGGKAGLFGSDGIVKDTDISDELRYIGSADIEYAENFAADFYDGGYEVLKIADGSRFLLIPEGGRAPDDLEEDIVVLEKPVEKIYLVTSAAMSSFCELDALDTISFSGTRADSWYLEKARAAMESGDILYAGKYNAPDYEKIMAEKCQLSIQNTMILHSPEVKETLEKFGIPVLVDYSSYESHPLGRSEWIKFYGVLTGKYDEAVRLFDVQEELVNGITAKTGAGGRRNEGAAEAGMSGSDTAAGGREDEASAEAGMSDSGDTAGSGSSGKKVAFFYISSNGSAVVRRSNDYIPKMIEMAGGRYIFEELGEDKVSASVNLQLEKFYAAAADADYLIYNSTVDGVIESVDQLIAKCPVLADLKAVKAGNVYCTGKNFYQETNVCGLMVEDLYNMMNGEEPENFLYRAKS